MPASGTRFEGTDRYIATDDLMLAVNAAITLQRPLLIKGEPGTGKTLLAEEVARSLAMPLIEWHIKSSTKAQHGLYEYDAVPARAIATAWLRGIAADAAAARRDRHARGRPRHPCRDNRW